MLSVKPNFKRLGPRCGKAVKLIATELNSVSQDDIALLKAGGKLIVEGYELTADDVLIEGGLQPSEFGAVSTDGSILVELDFELNEALVAEGFARELTTRVNALRRQANCDVSAKIEIIMHCDYMMFAVMMNTWHDVRNNFMNDVNCNVLTLLSPKNVAVIFSKNETVTIDNADYQHGTLITINGIPEHELDDMEVYVSIEKSN